jgi:hypothetical protein
LVITFSNGEEGLYSEELLYSFLPEAKNLLTEHIDKPED